MRILFQGDSITDGNRYKDPSKAWDLNHQMGHGYAFAINALLGSSYYDRDLEFVNRGVSGNAVEDLLARFDEDFAAVGADVVSILVGVNDALRPEPVEPAVFEERYKELLWKLYDANPKVKVILMEPFVMPVGNLKDNFDAPYRRISDYQDRIRRLAKDSNATHVPLQTAFCKAAKLREPEYWCWDGVHPTVSGHGLIAGEWINRAKEIVLG